MIDLILIFSLFLITLCTSFYYSRVHAVFKLFCFSLFTISGVLFYETYTQYLGAPIQGIPEYEFLYIHHTIDVHGNVTLWATDTENTEKQRLYQFPYERETAKKLEQAQEQTGNDTQVSGKFEKVQNVIQLHTSEWEDNNAYEYTKN